VESGISSPSDVRRFHELGADAFLVGESLVRSADLEEAVRTIKGATRRRTA
jgi:indole-3-glycerol phosphate synthase